MDKMSDFYIFVWYYSVRSRGQNLRTLLEFWFICVKYAVIIRDKLRFEKTVRILVHFVRYSLIQGREDVTFDFWHMAYTWHVELQTG